MRRKKNEAVEEETPVEIKKPEPVTDNLIDESVEAETPVEKEAVEEEVAVVDIEPVTDNLIDESVEAETPVDLPDPVEIKKPAEKEEIKLTGNSVQELQVAIRKLL